MNDAQAKVIPTKHLIRKITAQMGSFCCMLCGEMHADGAGIRRSLNAYIDVYHCIHCCGRSDADVTAHIKKYIDVPLPPGVDEVASTLAEEFVKAAWPKYGDFGPELKGE